MIFQPKTVRNLVKIHFAKSTTASTLMRPTIILFFQVEIKFRKMMKIIITWGNLEQNPFPSLLKLYLRNEKFTSFSPHFICLYLLLNT